MLHPDESPTIAQAKANGSTFPGLHNRDHWLLLPVSQQRDSNALERSNWRIVLKDLGGESDTLEIHRFSHWVVGWCEIAIISPERRKEADAWRKALNDYPCASDDDYSALELEENNEH